MIRTALIISGILLLLFLVWGFWPRRTHRIKDTVASLEPRIAMIMRSGDLSFLIIKVAGTEDFLQLSAASDQAQVSFPLVTERQRGLEKQLREAAAELSLSFRESRGTDGSRFLDCDFAGSSREVAETCHYLLKRLFAVSDETPLLFETNANI